MAATRRAFLVAGAAACVPAWALQLIYGTVPRTDNGGIGKTYMGREIAGVMGFEGAAWLEREEREKEERTDLLLRELQLRPGMQVADIGAGSGYLSRRIAPLVAPGGTVFAVDVQPQMVKLLEEGARKAGLGNVRALLGAKDSVPLAPDSVDLAVLVDVYHELEYPMEVMRSLIAALRPGARLVLVEYRAEDPRVPIKPLHKMSETQVRAELEGQPLVFERNARSLPWQHVLVFRKSPLPSRGGSL